MANTDKCLIWGTPAEIGNSETKDVRSDRAGGEYSVPRMMVGALGMDDAEPYVKARLTSWIIHQHRLGERWPLITPKIIEEVRRRQPMPINQRAEMLLVQIQTRLKTIGDTIKMPPAGQDEMLLAWTESVKMNEVSYLFDFLERLAWVERKKPESPDGTKEYNITPQGYLRLEDIAKKPVDSKQAFVAMWFDDSMGEAYENGIAPGIRDAGYEPVRIDGKEHNNKIDDEIIAEIRRSRFLVADFTQGETGARGGVYYEAGFAHGLNIPVIFTCRKDVIDKVHFDTRQYNHIAWETHEELSKRLSQRISATIGDGPLKKN
jgi:hypothetical protein